MEAQEVEVPRAQTQQGEMLEPKNRDVDARHLEPPQSIAAEIEALEAEENETSAAEAGAGDGDADAEQGRTLEAPTEEVCIEEDETQLAAIRELMVRACARGIWLTLAEIAEATEFAEASISAQLRHLRKAHHGGYHVEKRRKQSGHGAVTVRKIRDARRGPVIWEYRVLPPA
jgi:cell division septation protein DedD